MSKKYMVNKPAIGEVVVGAKMDIKWNNETIPARVIHVGVLGQRITLVNPNEAIMFHIEKTGMDSYTITSVGQILKESKQFQVGENNIEFRNSRICAITDKTSSVRELQVGDILIGALNPLEYRVQYVEGKILVVKATLSGNLYSYDKADSACELFKGLSFR